MRTTVRSLVAAAALVVPSGALAQPGPGGPGGPGGNPGVPSGPPVQSVPVDGGLALLALAGGAYATRRLRAR